jgi:L,D-transpeptidase catalytic domain
VANSKSLWRGVLVASALALSSVSAWALKVDISVNKISQKMTVTVDGEQQYVWLVSTGGQGYDTPSGSYHIFRMEKEHFSKEWDDAPMPYSMFFTGRGHAIHGSYHIKRLGTRASHGCVRLAPENAAILFDLVQEAGSKNSTVTIKGGFFDSGPALTASNQPRRPFLWFLNQPKKVKVDKVAKVIKVVKIVKAVKVAEADLVKVVKPLKKKKKVKDTAIIGGIQG